MHGARKIPTLLIAGLAGAACGLAQTKPPPPRQGPATVPAEQTPGSNPALAEHDLDVGKFYQKRGDVDGAIARYKDALRYKPDFAEPCLLLGQAYEQKRDFSTAIRYYQQYRKILPGTSEARKLGKRISELQKRMKKNEE